MTLLQRMLDRHTRLHGRLARAFRVVAACLMLLGMGPSPDVIADTVNGWGHEAVVEVAEDGCCDASCATSGCATHHCGCCVRAAPLPDAAAPPELRLVLVEPVAPARPYHEGVGPKRAIPPPVRPPIG